MQRHSKIKEVVKKPIVLFHQNILTLVVTKSYVVPIKSDTVEKTTILGLVTIENYSREESHSSSGFE